MVGGTKGILSLALIVLLASGCSLPAGPYKSPTPTVKAITRLAGFEPSESWSGGEADTDNVREGTQSLKLTASGGIQPTTVECNLKSSLDLSSAVTMTIWVFIKDASQLPQDKSRVVITLSLVNPGSRMWFYEIPRSRLKTGWNEIAIWKNQWKAYNSPSWTEITSLKVGVYSAEGQTVKVSFDNWYATPF